MTAEEAFQTKESKVAVTTKGKVVKLLEDDTEGSPHQRFIVELHSGHTLLISNNLDLAYRVPVKINDIVEVKGTYVWNQYGGLIHDTHHDSRGEHVDGYIILSKEYQA